MERIPRGIYTKEFREQAVRLREAEGLTIPEVARRLSLPPGTLKHWVYAARQGRLGAVGTNQRPRKTLGYYKPADRLEASVAATG